MAQEQILRKISTFFSSTPGRDKTSRLLQYLAMTISAYEKNRKKAGDKSCDGQKMEKLATTMSMTRKVLRIGKPVGNLMQVILVIRKLQQAAFRKPHESKTLLTFKGIKDLLLIFYYLCDHLIGIINKEQMKKKMEKWGYISWFLALFSTIFYQLEFLNKIDQLQQLQKDDEAAVKKAKLERKACFIELSRVILDIPVAAWHIKSDLVPELLVGVLGLITSFIGSYQAWAK